MSARPTVAILCFVLASRLLWAQGVSPVSDDTLQLLEEHPGLQALIQGDKVVALYGVPFAGNDGTPAKSVGDFVDDWQFVDSFNGKSGHKEALGVPDVELEFCDSIVSEDVVMTRGRSLYPR